MESYTKKVVLLGDGAVGKTSLIRKFVYSKFDDDYITTVGTKVSKKDIRLKDGNDVNLNIWDVLGQHDYSRVQNRAFQGAQGVMFVVDLTRQDTYQAILDYWLPEIISVTGDIPMVLMGNKVDLVDERVIGTDVLQGFAEKFCCTVHESSAKTGIHVDQAFRDMAALTVDSTATSCVKLDLVKDLITAHQKHERNIFMDVTDEIIHDFCSQYTNVDDGMPIIRKQFEMVELDVKAPSEAKLIKAIWRLAEVEAGILPSEQVTKNRFKRMKMVKRIKLANR